VNFSLNIHDVSDIILGPVREYRNHDAYATRILEIKTPQGTFEISLFSKHVSLDDETELLKVKL
jgi:hypothetical protein